MKKVDEIFIVEYTGSYTDYFFTENFIKLENAKNFAELVNGTVKSIKTSDARDSDNKVFYMKKIYQLYIVYNKNKDAIIREDIESFVSFNELDWKNFNKETYYYLEEQELIKEFYIEEERYDLNYYLNLMKNLHNKIEDKIKNENYNEDMINEWLKTID